MLSDRIRNKLEELQDSSNESMQLDINKRKERLAELEKLAETFSDIVPEKCTLPYNHLFVAK